MFNIRHLFAAGEAVGGLPYHNIYDFPVSCADFF
jgi:hypothetical protein